MFISKKPHAKLDLFLIRGPCRGDLPSQRRWRRMSLMIMTMWRMNRRRRTRMNPWMKRALMRLTGATLKLRKFVRCATVWRHLTQYHTLCWFFVLGFFGGGCYKSNQFPTQKKSQSCQENFGCQRSMFGGEGADVGFWSSPLLYYIQLSGFFPPL